jgi:hypothetical protein
VRRAVEPSAERFDQLRMCAGHQHGFELQEKSRAYRKGASVAIEPMHLSPGRVRRTLEPYALRVRQHAKSIGFSAQNVLYNLGGILSLETGDSI